MYAARSSVSSELTIGSGGDGGRSPRPTRRSGIVSGAVPDPRLAVCAVLGATRRASPSGESHFSCRFLQKSSPGKGELKPLTERGGGGDRTTPRGRSTLHLRPGRRCRHAHALRDRRDAKRATAIAGGRVATSNKPPSSVPLLNDDFDGVERALRSVV